LVSSEKNGSRTDTGLGRSRFSAVLSGASNFCTSIELGETETEGVSGIASSDGHYIKIECCEKVKEEKYNQCRGYFLV